MQGTSFMAWGSSTRTASCWWCGSWRPSPSLLWLSKGYRARPQRAPRMSSTGACRAASISLGYRWSLGDRLLDQLIILPAPL